MVRVPEPIIRPPIVPPSFVTVHCAQHLGCQFICTRSRTLASVVGQSLLLKNVDAV